MLTRPWLLSDEPLRSPSMPDQVPCFSLTDGLVLMPYPTFVLYRDEGPPLKKPCPRSYTNRVLSQFN